MSERDVEIVRNQFQAVNERDWGRAMSLYADDVALVVREGFLDTGTFEGKDAVGAGSVIGSARSIATTALRSPTAGTSARAWSSSSPPTAGAAG